jgi:hypothetical protein
VRDHMVHHQGVELLLRTREGVRPQGPPDELLYINSRLIPTKASESTGRHWTYLLPYEDFDSLLSLGKAVVERVYGRAGEREGA